MRKPIKPETNFMLQIHHVVEAMQDDMENRMKEAGITPEQVAAFSNNPDTANLDGRDETLVAIFATVDIMHSTMHDLMEFGDLRKIRKPNLRRLVTRHKSSIEEGLTPDQLKEFREGLGL